MIRRSSLRWRLVAWVVATMLVVLAIVFVVVYEQTGSQLRAQTDQDVHGDVGQLSEAVRTMHPASPAELVIRLRRYIGSQPYRGQSSLLFAVVPGDQTVSNHPETLGNNPPDGETQAEQGRENALGRKLLSGPVGPRTALVPDIGRARIDERLVSSAGLTVRLGAGESLSTVERAQRSVAKAFVLAGAVGLALVLIASYLAGAFVSRPLRRLARVAGRVDDGDLHPRMAVSDMASQEIRVLAESFNHMLDRLSIAFADQKRFVADASHELRTPLTVIAGQLEVLAATDRPSADDIQRTQRLVGAEVARTSRLVDDMLLLTRSEHEDFLRVGELDLREFVDDLWTTSTAGGDRTFVLGRVPAGMLRADPDRLTQALRNLIDNALAHTAAPDGLIALGVKATAAGWIRFTVGDDGPGIPEDQRERVFERFHRTDDARDRVAGGAGLGLSIVRAIAEAHGGHVRACERQGGGAQIELVLPGFTPAKVAHAPFA